ncbi:MAG: radical SAM protein [Desulfobacteraceae bacterium]|nr:radical SAM protein [Desulfobacteraceae bacterium]
MSSSTAEKYSFETGVYRPPSEGGNFSLLVRLTRNCPWNRCGFCSMYKSEKFEVRSVAQIKQDIDAMAFICNDLSEISHRLGHGGQMTRDTVMELFNKAPELNYHQGLSMLFQWFAAGGKTVFLQDANSLIMKTDDLVQVLQYLRKTFPSIERVTTYARSKTISRKSLDELTAIEQAGLNRLHVGLETGDDGLLKIIKKGVTAQGHIKGGQKALEAGFQLSEYWMPGLGGKKFWKDHATNTAKVLNAINPHYIRSRPFYALPGTPLHEQVQAETLELQSPNELLTELKLTMQTLDVTSKVCFDHAGNYWKNRQGDLLLSHSYEGYQFPNEKQVVLDLIEQGLAARNRRPIIRNL